MSSSRSLALIDKHYQQYLVDQDGPGFAARVMQRYTIGSLERLVTHPHPLTRRAAMLAISLCGDYKSNAVVGRALTDIDRGMRMMAEDTIRILWRREGSKSQRRRLDAIIRMNAASHFQRAVATANRLLSEDPGLAEPWFHRAAAYFNLGRYDDSIRDCRQTLELNPLHFDAAIGLGKCYLQLGDRQAALTSFSLALKLNPNLENVRAHVAHLQRALRQFE